MELQKMLVHLTFPSVILTSPLGGACLPWDRLPTAASMASPTSLEQHLGGLFLSEGGCPFIQAGEEKPGKLDKALKV